MTKTSVRSRGTGSVRNRGTERQPKWFAYYSLSIDGRRRQISRGPFDLKKEAEGWLRDQLQRKSEGRATVATKVTVAQLLDEWLAARRRSMGPGVRRGHVDRIRFHIKPHIGHVKARELRPAHVDHMLEQLRQPGASRRGRKIDMHGERTRPSDKGLSGTSCQHVLGTLSVALEWAVKRGDLPRNVARDVDRPQRDTEKFAVWSADELGRFLDHVADDRLLPLWRLAAYTGARRSELLGLRWDDVDLDASTIAIRRARVRVAYEMHDLPRTKTKQSERVVSLDPETMQVLRQWRKAQKAERLAWGPAWTDSGYVFTAEDGQPIHADHIARRYGRLVKAADAPAIRFHDLRHTHATLMLKAGVPVHVVSKRLGHASAKMTLDVYAGHLPGDSSEAAAAFAAQVAGGGR